MSDKTSLEYLEALHEALLTAKYGHNYEKVVRERLEDQLSDEKVSLAMKTDALMRSEFKRTGTRSDLLEMSTSTEEEVKKHLDVSSILTSGNFSRFEHPAFVRIIENARIFVDAGMKGFKDDSGARDAFNSITFGTLEDTTYNAYVVPVPNSNSFVSVLNLGLITLVSRLSRIINTIQFEVPSEEQEKIPVVEDEDQWMSNYADLVWTTLTRGKSKDVPKIFLEVLLEYVGIPPEKPFEHRRFANISKLYQEFQTVGAEIFVLGHEIGHVFNGDFRDKSNTTIIYAANQDLAICSSDHAKEFKADAFGAFTVINASKNVFHEDAGEAMDYFELGPRLFFLCQESIEKFLKLLGISVPEYTSHPPTRDRAYLVDQVLNDYRSPNHFGRSKRVWTTMEVLWQATQSEFEANEKTIRDRISTALSQAKG